MCPLNELLLVTLDTNCVEDTELRRVLTERGADIAVADVTEWEGSGSDVVQRHIAGIKRVLAPGIWAETPWEGLMHGHGRWVDHEGREHDGSPIQEILRIVSNGSHSWSSPPTHRQRAQTRDAMILSAHIQSARRIFISNDSKAFIRGGRREALESRFGIRIYCASEAIREFRSRSNDAGDDGAG